MKSVGRFTELIIFIANVETFVERVGHRALGFAAFESGATVIRAG